jgi:hypothetical protein
VTATGTTVGTCGIRIADDVGQMSNVEVEVAGGTLSVTPAALPFQSSTSPPQDVAASDPGADSFTCTSSDTTDVTATITSQTTGSATCSIGPTGNGFVGTAQVTFADSLPGSSAVVQVGVGTQPLFKHHRVTPGGTKRPLPSPRGPQRPVAPLPLPNPNGPSFDVSAQQLTLAARFGRQTITANVFDYRGALIASSSAPQIADAIVSAGNGPVRFIAIVAKAPGSATIRITDERGNSRYVRVTVVPPASGRPVPDPRPGGPPRS